MFINLSFGGISFGASRHISYEGSITADYMGCYYAKNDRGLGKAPKAFAVALWNVIGKTEECI